MRLYDSRGLLYFVKFGTLGALYFSNCSHHLGQRRLSILIQMADTPSVRIIEFFLRIISSRWAGRSTRTIRISDFNRSGGHPRKSDFWWELNDSSSCLWGCREAPRDWESGPRIFLCNVSSSAWAICSYDWGYLGMLIDLDSLVQLHEETE